MVIGPRRSNIWNELNQTAIRDLFVLDRMSSCVSALRYLIAPCSMQWRRNLRWKFVLSLEFIVGRGIDLTEQSRCSEILQPRTELWRFINFARWSFFRISWTLKFKFIFDCKDSQNNKKKCFMHDSSRSRSPSRPYFQARSARSGERKTSHSFEVERNVSLHHQQLDGAWFSVCGGAAVNTLIAPCHGFEASLKNILLTRKLTFGRVPRGEGFPHG